MKPILVVMSWRGGQRLQRCLDSLRPAHEFFDRILISVTAEHGSDDDRLAQAFATEVPNAESLCTGAELPTMQHQAKWVDYLQSTGVTSNQWIYWLAYDDEVRLTGIRNLVDAQGNWPLEAGTAYIGPWAMRHESPDRLFDGDPAEPLESWTAFPSDGPRRMPVMDWIAAQLRQPTYMQMSGSVMPFSNYLALRDQRPRKSGPMRIEMAAASAPGIDWVQEFSEPISIIYGRSNSDRASYGKLARREDAHLIQWLGRRALRDPRELGGLLGSMTSVTGAYTRAALQRGELPSEEWRVRGVVEP